MNITGSQNDYIRNLVNTIVKGKTLNMGTVQYGTLYLLVNSGLLYDIQIPDFRDINCSFSDLDYKLDESQIIDNQTIFFESRMPEIILGTDITRNSYSMIYDNPNIRELKEFEDIINAKSADGAFRYFVDTSEKRIFMYLQKSMFGLNKSDKCSLKIYKTNLIYSLNNTVSEYLAKFIIYKSKFKTPIELSFKFLS